jgi:hypothetical protein
MPLLPRAQQRRGARVGQRAAGLEVGQHDGLLRVHDLGRLGHEVDAAEHDHFGLGVARALGELERVAEVVGDVLDVRVLVVVRQDHGVARLAQSVDLGEQVETRVDRGHPRIIGRGSPAAKRRALLTPLRTRAAARSIVPIHGAR